VARGEPGQDERNFYSSLGLQHVTGMSSSVRKNGRSPDEPASRSCVTYTFALYSPMLLSMFQGPSARKTFVVACKKCRRDVPTGAGEFPFQSIVVECPLCGEKRRYLPSEVFLGRVDQLVNRQKRAGAV